MPENIEKNYQRLTDISESKKRDKEVPVIDAKITRPSGSR